MIFFDPALSEPAGTSCASCHEPGRAFSGNNRSPYGIARGSRADAFGIRNTPSLMYQAYTPVFVAHRYLPGVPPSGGLFLDGRADTLEEQAAGPLLGPQEMANPDRATVVSKIARSAYADAFRSVFGADVFADIDRAFAATTTAISDFERTRVFRPFSSKYDVYLRGSADLSEAENRGRRLFFDSERGNCVACHAANGHPGNPEEALFTDFSYRRIQVPRNRAIPRNRDTRFADLGLAGPERGDFGGSPDLRGAFKVPTLRDVALKEAFMHNGRFRTLEEVVTFYVTRDTDPWRWYPEGRFDDLPDGGDAAAAEVGPPFAPLANGKPRLDPHDIADVVAFLQALTDVEFDLAGAGPSR